MKKILLILCIFMLTGCSEYVEINDLGVVTGILLDYKDNEFELTSQLIVIEKESKVVTYTTTGKTVDEALSKVSKLIDKELFISHLKVLILTDNIIKNNIKYEDFFLRNSKSRKNFYVYTTTYDNPKELLNIYNDIDGSSLYLNNLMSFNDKVFSSSTPLEFTDLIYKKLEYGIDIIYPNITIIENNNEKVLYLSNLIAYSNDNKIILNDSESIIYNILINNLEKTLIDIACDDELFSININNSKTKFKFINGKFYITSNIKAKLNNYNCKYSLESKETITLLNNIIASNIKSQIENLIKKSINSKIDFLGITNYIYKRNKNFNKDTFNLDNTNIDINVDAALISTGEIR